MWNAAAIRDVAAGRSVAIRAALLAAGIAALALLMLVPTASAFKRVDSFIGSPTGERGTDGDLFSSPRGVAINQNGNGGVPAGEIYVVSSNRVQEFSPAGEFVRTWGKDVVKPGAPNDTGTGFEVCDATAPVPNVPSDCKRGEDGSLGGEMQQARQIAIDQATGDVYVGEPTRIQKFSATGSFLLSFGWDVVQGGVTTFEICSVAANCQNGPLGMNAGQFNGNGIAGSGSLTVGPSGDVYRADIRNRRVQRFKSSGEFVSAWGWNVIPAGQPGDLGSAYERCPASAADAPGACQSGEAGPALGQFGRADVVSGSQGPDSIAASESGSIYMLDNGNGRIVTADATGASLTTFFESPAIDSPLGGPIVAPGPEGRWFIANANVEGEDRILELGATGELLSDEHMRGSGLTAAGFAVNLSSGDLYVTSKERLFTLDDDGAAPPPEVTVDPASGITAHSATLSGTINPNGPGIRTTYRLEYARQGSGDWKAVEGTALEPADGNVPQAVSAEVHDLEANADYEVRIVAAKEFGATDPVVGGPVHFNTPAAPPEVRTLGLQGFTDTTAIVSATVNPNNEATSYAFEWGETDAYGNRAPLSSATLEGGTPRYVSEILDGLEPDTTYHFRIVAESDSGTSHGDDRTFTTRAPFAGFVPRAFEQISPRSKESDVESGGIILGGGEESPPLPASRDGDHKAFGMWGALDSSEWGVDRITKVLAQRTARGWELEDISPWPRNPSPVLFAGRIVGVGGADLGRQLVVSEQLLRVRGKPDLEPGLHLRDSASGSYLTIAEFTRSSSDGFGVSPMMDYVAFEQQGNLTSEPGIPASVKKVYEWDGEGLRVASVDTAGQPFASASAIGGGEDSSGGSRLNAVSKDGKHLFFSTPLGNSTSRRIYRRDHGAATVLASPSKRTPPDPLGPRAKIYLDATLDQSPDGPAAVFFASKEKLTNAATKTGPSSGGLGDLYRYEINRDRLTNVTAAANGASGAELLGVLGRSADGDAVYYAAAGEVLPGKGVSGKPNVYLWRDDGTASGETTFVATLASSQCELGALFLQFPSIGDGCNFPTAVSGGDPDSHRTAHVSSDGSKLLFQSTASPTGFPSAGHSELYLYEADANRGAGQLSCLSCDPSGQATQRATLAPPAGSSPSWIGSLGQDPVRAMVGNGERVFFDSPSALVPEDINGTLDVYEWSAGRLNLISTGKSQDRSRFEGASFDGSTVFLTTREALVGVDDDKMTDLYAARVGGGFAFQNPPPPGVPCTGDACKPPASPLPPLGPMGSTTFHGTGNYAPAFRVARITAKQRRAAARRGRLKIRVRVERPGRIVVRARSGKRGLGRAVRRAGSAGRVAVTLKLNRAARRTLARRGRLRLQIEVRFAGETQRASLNLRRSR